MKTNMESLAFEQEIQKERSETKKEIWRPESKVCKRVGYWGEVLWKEAGKCNAKKS